MTGKVTVDDRVWREIKKRLARLARGAAKVGIVGADAGADHGGSTNAEIGAAHEYGTESIAQRSFIRQTFEKKRADMIRLKAALAKRVIEMTLEPEAAIGLLGAWGAGAIKATITRDGEFAPLKPATIARKGSSRPLVDSAQMLNSISWLVVS